MTNSSVLVKPNQGSILRFDNADLSFDESYGTLKIWRSGLMVALFAEGTYAYVMVEHPPAPEEPSL